MNPLQSPVVRAIMAHWPDATIKMRDSRMADTWEEEFQARRIGGVRAGEYLESIGKTDLAALTGAEWNTLLEVIIEGYLTAKDDQRTALSTRTISGSL